MPYKDGSWGKKAKARFERRKKSGEFARHSRLKYYSQRRAGFVIPKEIDISSISNLNKCQICGIENSKKRFKSLIIHHKDKNNKNNCLENLLLICRGCHNTVHKSKKVEAVK